MLKLLVEIAAIVVLVAGVAVTFTVGVALIVAGVLGIAACELGS